MKWPLLLSIFYAATIVSAQHSHGGMTMNETVPAFNSTGDEPMSYALFPDNKSYFYVHVSMMVLAFWVLMPMGTVK
jgi:hypothetical protein